MKIQPPKELRLPEIVIDVTNGIATVAHNASGVEVTIVNHDRTTFDVELAYVRSRALEELLQEEPDRERAAYFHGYAEGLERAKFLLEKGQAGKSTVKTTPRAPSWHAYQIPTNGVGRR